MIHRQAVDIDPELYLEYLPLQPHPHTIALLLFVSKRKVAKK